MVGAEEVGECRNAVVEEEWGGGGAGVAPEVELVGESVFARGRDDGRFQWLDLVVRVDKL